MSLPFEDLEAFYEALAERLDQVGPDNELLFLAKLALALADQSSSKAAALACLDKAMIDVNEARSKDDQHG